MERAVKVEGRERERERGQSLKTGEGWTHFHILQRVLLRNAPQHILLRALLQLSSNQELVKDEVRFLEVEDDVELAHVAVVLIHLLDVAVHDLEGY